MPLMPEQVNLNSIVSRDDVEVKVEVAKAEHAEERVARLRIEERDSYWGHIKGFVLFIGVAVGIFVSLSLCGYLIVTDGNASPDTKRWAETLFASLITGVASFLGGKAVGGK